MAPAQANFPEDFPPEIFELRGFCDACGYSAAVCRARIPVGLSVQTLARRLRCTACGSRETGMRIIYTGAGGFRHGFPGLPARPPMATAVAATSGISRVRFEVADYDRPRRLPV
jgi:hypothetical protein